MKHTLKITLWLVLIFFIAQIIGLSVTNKYIDHKKTALTGNIAFEKLPYNLERPEIKESISYIWIMVGVIAGTLILLLLIKFKKMFLWKLWFFLAVFSTTAIAFAAFMNSFLAAILAFALALMKVYKPIAFMQNLTEIFIYGGLAAIFVPIINVFAAFMLLILISVYDIIAVKRTKHMITLAKFQTKSKVFAGLFISYNKKAPTAIKAMKKIEKNAEGSEKGKIAVLGGGDIGFPLIFAGVIMKGLMLTNTEIIGFLKALIIPVCATIALLFLLIKGKKDKFYPAMPYLSAGCFIGYAILAMM
ncbi:hypothetical protein HYX01_03785 [Candidatus Woesearchaeota archaeon]|nr:hypothetical protein [Candidatus Woesearchaeota archaeon]